VTARLLVRLLPLLGLLLLATYFGPARPDDEAGYLELASRLANGWYVTGNDAALLDADPSYPDLWFGPGLPTILSPLVAADLPLWLTRAAGPLSLFGAVVALCALLRLRFSERAALGGAYAFGLYVPSYTLLPNLHSEPPAILFLVLGMLATARHLESGSTVTLVGAGASLAALALTRVAFGWVLTAVLVASAFWWILRRAPSAAGTVRIAAVALALCVPWLAYTLHVTGRPLVWGNSGSLSLYWMSSPHPNDYGDWHRADRVFSEDRLAPHRPFFATLEHVPLAEQNERLERRALENIQAHPLKYASNVAANISRMFFNAPYSAEPQTPKAAVYAFPNALVLGAIVLSVALLARRRHDLPPETLPFALLAGSTLGLHAFVASYPRMLIPVVPIVIWLCLLALSRNLSGGGQPVVGEAT
jgi:hypothetical protein